MILTYLIVKGFAVICITRLLDAVTVMYFMGAFVVRVSRDALCQQISRFPLVASSQC